MSCRLRRALVRCKLARMTKRGLSGAGVKSVVARATVGSATFGVGALVLLGLASGAGCSSSSSTGSPAPSPTVAPGNASGGHHEGEHQGGGDHHGAMPATVRAYHEVLRPLWHSDPGPERDARICAQANDLAARADAVAADGVPPAHAERSVEWHAATASLVDRTRAVQRACAANTQAGVPTALSAAHDAFHALIELRGH